MSEDSYDDIHTIVLDIKRYLDAHPNSADTIEGVASWWLTRQRLENSITKIQEALNYLISKELIDFSVLPDGTRIYKRRN